MFKKCNWRLRNVIDVQKMWLTFRKNVTDSKFSSLYLNVTIFAINASKLTKWKLEKNIRIKTVLFIFWVFAFSVLQSFFWSYGFLFRSSGFGLRTQLVIVKTHLQYSDMSFWKNRRTLHSWGLMHKTFFASLKWKYEPKWSLKLAVQNLVLTKLFKFLYSQSLT